MVLRPEGFMVQHEVVPHRERNDILRNLMCKILRRMEI